MGMKMMKEFRSRGSEGIVWCRGFTFALGLVLTLAACSGDDDGNRGPVADTPTEVSTATPTDTPTAMPTVTPDVQLENAITGIRSLLGGFECPDGRSATRSEWGPGGDARTTLGGDHWRHSAVATHVV